MTAGCRSDRANCPRDLHTRVPGQPEEDGNPRYLHLLAGTGFVVIGIWTLVRA
jgi:hypothetical protein